MGKESKRYITQLAQSVHSSFLIGVVATQAMSQIVANCRESCREACGKVLHETLKATAGLFEFEFRQNAGAEQFENIQ
jgi:hypothetical protein